MLKVSSLLFSRVSDTFSKIKSGSYISVLQLLLETTSKSQWFNTIVLFLTHWRGQCRSAGGFPSHSHLGTGLLSFNSSTIPQGLGVPHGVICIWLIIGGRAGSFIGVVWKWHTSLMLLFHWRGKFKTKLTFTGYSSEVSKFIK